MTSTAPSKSEPPLAESAFNAGSTDDSLERMTTLFARHGDTYRVFVPARKAHAFVIHHPDDVRRVLVTNHRNYTKGYGIDRIKLLLGTGIMTSEGDLWTSQRYMMQPFFHRRVVTEFASVVATANDDLVRQWETQAARDATVNVTEDMSELTLNIVLRSIFGADLDRLRLEAGGNPFELITRDTARNLEFVYKFRALTRVLMQLIARRRAQPEEHFDFLGMLMDARDKDTGQGMSDGQLINEVMTLIVAGHETTASGLNWAWYLLSQHPEAELRLHAEIDAAPEIAAPSLAQMEALGFTQQVLNESLRLYPPGWVLYRRTIGADVLGGFSVAPDTDVVLPLYLTHRHPRFWRDPEAFRPERFSRAHEQERPRFAYMPFAAGPRHCIGETLALYEMLMNVYKVARHFRLAYVQDKPIELEAQINLRTRHPLHMRLQRR